MSSKKIKIFAVVSIVISIISFFLPWIGAKAKSYGPNMLKISFKHLDFGDLSSDFIILGVAYIVILLLPTLLCISNLLCVFNKRSFKKAIPILALIVWFGLIVTVVANSRGGIFSNGFGMSHISSGIIGSLVSMLLVTIMSIMGSKKEVMVTEESNELMKRCHNCNTVLENGARFCVECGKAVETSNE